MKTDVVIIGAGAAGLMTAIEASKRGRRVTVLEKTNRAGKKILMSGGGRCNFTNTGASPAQYISRNPHFCKSALSRYTPADFIALVESYGVQYYEKKLGQLFCVGKSQEILDILLQECQRYGVDIHYQQAIQSVDKKDYFMIRTEDKKQYCADALVLATGGLSIPSLGSSPFGYQLASQFGLEIHPTRAGLVPLTLSAEQKEKYACLSGISVAAKVSCGHQSFEEDILFTHRGLSGPGILQISSFWQANLKIRLQFIPEIDWQDYLWEAQRKHPDQLLKNQLQQVFAKKLIEQLMASELLHKPMKQLMHKDIETLTENLTHFEIKPGGTEGYRTAEVTLGGVSCDELSSKTMQAKKVSGLYVVGELMDVTGYLGGYNFQWAWSSAFAAAQDI